MSCNLQGQILGVLGSVPCSPWELRGRNHVQFCCRAPSRLAPAPLFPPAPCEPEISSERRPSEPFKPSNSLEALSFFLLSVFSAALYNLSAASLLLPVGGALAGGPLYFSFEVSFTASSGSDLTSFTSFFACRRAHTSSSRHVRL